MTVTAAKIQSQFTAISSTAPATASKISTILTAAPLGLLLTPENLRALAELQAETGSSMQTEAGVVIEIEGAAQHSIVTSAKFHTILTALSS